MDDPLSLLFVVQVKIWFQNRRMKWRNSKERELIATGGSREQTLPTKNNPNPDLSDPILQKKDPSSDNQTGFTSSSSMHHGMSLHPAAR
jgi:hypothetical protein